MFFTIVLVPVTLPSFEAALGASRQRRRASRAQAEPKETRESRLTARNAVRVVFVSMSHACTDTQPIPLPPQDIKDEDTTQDAPLVRPA